MLNVSPLNLLLTVLNLLVLLVLMRKFLYKPVLDVIARRQELIDGQFKQAGTLKEEAEQLKKQYELQMAEIKEEQEKTVKEAGIKAREEYDKILADANRKAGRIVEEAKKTGEEERVRIQKAAEVEMAGMVAAAAAKIVSDTASEQNNRVIYDEFLKKAGEMCETGSR